MDTYFHFRVIKIIGSALLFFLISSCGSDSAKTPIETSNSSTLNPTKGVTQEESFYVRLYDDGKYPYYMSQKNNYDKKCEITLGASSQNVECILDINELDLYFNGVKFQYNIPSSMCSYMSYTPYWYYNWEPGYGPSAVSISKSLDVSGNLLSLSCVIDGVATCNGTEASYDATNDKLTCVYDHTNASGPNCCLGSYTKTVVTTVAAGAPVTSYGKANWGGEIKGCLGGQGKTNWSLYTKSGYPASEIFYTVGTGKNDVYEVTAPIQSSNAGSNFGIANYFTSGKHNHNGYSSGSSTYPYQIDPIDDRNGTALRSGSPYYRWQCLDKDKEVIHQIIVSVREWNTYKEFLTYGTSKGTSGDPDVVGVEGTGCDYNTQNATETCNDFTDWDDYYTLFSGIFSSVTKPSYFPNETF
ncbi:MAG: hypothetical protein J0M15_15885 [Deltaproteobacteria bacterium]|jgi:hypothetical protein|nr:hypothetical protein [Deltaproteobacteria bacterium]